MRSVGWGVIGCSDIVEKRAGAAIAAQSNSRLVAFQSRDGGRAKAFAQRFGAARWYDDVDRLLADDEIDVVYVATEVDRHAPLALAAMSAGKHVLVEKPMAVSTDECLSMIEAAGMSGVQLAVAYYARFLPRARLMKRLIDEGQLGQVVRANINVVTYYNPAADDPKRWRVSARAAAICSPTSAATAST